MATAEDKVDNNANSAVDSARELDASIPSEGGLYSRLNAGTLKRTDLLEQSPEEAARQASVKLASAKLITILWKREGRVVEPERSSVYGSCLLLPQVARSAGWPRELVLLVIRSYILLALAVGLQAALVYFMAKEEIVMGRLAGQSYLCDMGRNMRDCPDGPGCIGPGGTKYEISRLYGWGAFATRMFVKQSLKAMFPEKADTIEEEVDTGEFGVESHLCRQVACFLFAASLTSELITIFNTTWLLIVMPTQSKSWISYELPLEGYENDKAQAKAMLGVKELDCVKIKMIGMPLHWKVINFLVLLAPKVIVFLSTLVTGTSFLMETGRIDEGIVNSTALVFILSIDEMIYESLTNNFTRSVVESAEAYHDAVDTAHDDEKYTDAEALQAFESTRIRAQLVFIAGLLPARVFVSLAMSTVAVWLYYVKNCELSKDGVWVSKPQYTPVDESFSVLQAFLPMLFPKAHQPEPYWRYPG